jgi:hypothetical protein
MSYILKRLIRAIEICLWTFPVLVPNLFTNEMLKAIRQEECVKFSLSIFLQEKLKNSNEILSM